MSDAPELVIRDTTGFIKSLPLAPPGLPVKPVSHNTWYWQLSDVQPCPRRGQVFPVGISIYATKGCVNINFDSARKSCVLKHVPLLRKSNPRFFS